MKFDFEINNKRVEYRLNGFSGKIEIDVEGKQAAHGLLMIGGDKKTSFQMGDRKINVVIKQPLFLAVFRRRTFEVLVDGVLYQTFDHKGRLIKG